MGAEKEKSILGYGHVFQVKGCSSPIILVSKKMVDSKSCILYDIGVACGALQSWTTCFTHNSGALAQLGERIAGSDEVRGSIPLGSIQNSKCAQFFGTALFVFVWTFADRTKKMPYAILSNNLLNEDSQCYIIAHDWTSIFLKFAVNPN